jgi:uncharacterized protein (TIGR00369 family)
MKERLDTMNQACRGTLVETLGIEFTGGGEQWLEARMPIDRRTSRPGNLLHGGAIMALAETVGSGLSFIQAPPDEYEVYGIEINGNHVHRARGGYVTGRAEFMHKGQRTQVVAVRVTDEFGDLVSVCRVTNMLLPKQQEPGRL